MIDNSPDAPLSEQMLLELGRLMEGVTTADGYTLEIWQLLTAQACAWLQEQYPMDDTAIGMLVQAVVSVNARLLLLEGHSSMLAPKEEDAG